MQLVGTREAGGLEHVVGDPGGRGQLAPPRVDGRGGGEHRDEHVVLAGRARDREPALEMAGAFVEALGELAVPPEQQRCLQPGGHLGVGQRGDQLLGFGEGRPAGGARSFAVLGDRQHARRHGVQRPVVERARERVGAPCPTEQLRAPQRAQAVQGQFDRQLRGLDGLRVGKSGVRGPQDGRGGVVAAEHVVEASHEDDGARAQRGRAGREQADDLAQRLAALLEPPAGAERCRHRHHQLEPAFRLAGGQQLGRGSQPAGGSRRRAPGGRVSGLA